MTEQTAEQRAIEIIDNYRKSKREEASSPYDTVLAYYDGQAEREKEEIHKTARDVRSGKIISSNPAYGSIVYPKFLYEVIEEEFSKEAFDTLKENAELLCKKFGSKSDWDLENLVNNSNGQEWLDLTHLSYLVKAYNCAASQIDVKNFLDELNIVTTLVNEDRLPEDEEE